jgi:hypothetical protein
LDIHQTVVGYPRYLFSLPILASSAFQNVPYSYFIIFMHLKILIAQAFAVGGPGMLMAWYMTIILEFGEDALASREDIRAPLGMGGLS